MQVKHGACGPLQSMKVQRQLIARTPIFYRLEKMENGDSSVGYIHIKEFNALAKKDLVTGNCLVVDKSGDLFCPFLSCVITIPVYCDLLSGRSVTLVWIIVSF